MSKDPLGHELFEKRILDSIEFAEKEILQPCIRETTNPLPKHWITTGIGSSQAHAQFLSYLINYFTPSSSEFIPTFEFIKPIEKYHAQEGLIVFSQGLSPNAQIPLRQQERFDHTVLFTATTVNGAQKTGEPTRMEILNKLKKNKQTIIHFNPENEYELLARVAGPFNAYIAAIKFANAYISSEIPLIPTKTLQNIFKKSQELINQIDIKEFTNKIAQGCHIISSAPISLFGKNLSDKFIEGALLPPPHIWDLLSFSHGPFQQLINNPRPIIILKSKTPEEDQLFNNAMPMINKASNHVLKIKSDLPEPWQILEYEIALNLLILKLMHALKINQRKWPGQGEDSALYGINSTSL